ncbi:hypothetical protein QBC35DRAFT_214956 [Podospora australis]|uniref:Uncharacterized protein n=1 Tax=Podospora australis TaxID=1536484 RepID=A0AAN7AI40_9PEZI|nr:hypothetical protein QBC35DRAFT_214956 [Podospora australis]
MPTHQLLHLFLMAVLTGKVTASPSPQFGSYLGDCKVTCSYPNMQLICAYPRLFCAIPGNFIIQEVGTCDLCSAYQPVDPKPAEPGVKKEE